MAFYILIPFLHREAIFMDTRIRFVQDDLYTTDNPAKYCKVQDSLDDPWTRYWKGGVTTRDFLTEASKCYGEL